MSRPEEGSVLDRRTLNRSLLARQLLLERVDLPPVDAVAQLVGMQTQVPLDPYIGLWSRLPAFDPVALGTALLERRLVRMTLMRATLHLVSAEDGLAMRPVLQAPIERASASSPFAAHLSGLELGPVISRGVELVNANRCRSPSSPRRSRKSGRITTRTGSPTRSAISFPWCR